MITILTYIKNIFMIHYKYNSITRQYIVEILFGNIAETYILTFCETIDKLAKTFKKHLKKILKAQYQNILYIKI